MDLEAIKKQAQNYEKDMTKLLRDLVRIPGESADEGKKLQRTKEEMDKLGFDKVEFDRWEIYWDIWEQAKH